MKNFEDEQIDRTLRVLGGTRTPEGLEGRVLQRLAERRMHTTPTLGMSWRLAWVGATVMVVAVVALMVRGSHEQGGSSGAVGRGATPAPATSPAFVGSATPGNGSRPKPMLQASSRKGDGLAPVVWEVRSYAAPEAPLTHEELLLIRIAQRVDAVEIAALDPKVWAMRDAEEKAAVAAFFVRPKPKVDGNGPLEVITAHGKSNGSIESDDGRDETSGHPAEIK